MNQLQRHILEQEKLARERVVTRSGYNAVNLLDTSGNPQGVNVSSGVIPVSLADSGNPMPVSGPLTDAQLRNSAVPVSGPLTDAQLRAAELSVRIADCLQSLEHTLRLIQKPIWWDNATNVLRTTAVVTSCTMAANQDLRTLTNMTQLGGNIASTAVLDMMKTNWGINIRGRIS